MKKVITFLTPIILLFQSASATLSPTATSEFCPNTNIQFTYTDFGEYINFSFADLVQTNASANSTIYYAITNTTVFTFTLRFTDVNQNKSIRINYNLKSNNAPYSTTYSFTKIKSLYS